MYNWNPDAGARHFLKNMQAGTTESLACLQGLNGIVGAGKAAKSSGKAGRHARAGQAGNEAKVPGLRRQLGSLGCPAYSIAIADQWLACSGGEPLHVHCTFHQDIPSERMTCCR